MVLTREFLDLFLGSLLLLIVILVLKQSLKNRSSITLIDISIWITATTFGLAPFVLILYGGQFPEANLLDVLMSYLGIIFFVLGLLVIKKYFNKSLNKNLSLADIIKKINNVNPKQVLLFYSIFFIVRAIFAFNYGIFSSGSATTERMESLPYLLFASRSLLDILFWGCILWSVVKVLSDKKLTLLPAIILIIEIFLIFFRGRRQMLYFVFLFLYIYLLLGYKFNFRIIIPSTIIIIILINIIFPLFLSFREISLGISKNSDLLENYSYSYYLLSQTGVDRSYYERNVAQRVYINTWNIDLLSKSSLVDGLNGQALLSSILLVVPRPLLPFKGTLKDPEYLINYNFGLELSDSPSNWPAYGFADFGLLGGFFYGLILGYLLYLFQLFAKLNFKRHPFIAFTILGAASFIAFFIEESPIAIFSLLRDAILLYFIFNFLNLFRRKKSKQAVVRL